MDGIAMDLKSQLERDSYAIVEDVFDPSSDFSPLYEEWTSILDDIVGRLTAEGALSSSFEQLPFEQRLVAVTEESGQQISGHFDISLPQRDIRPDTPVSASPAAFRLLTKDRLLDVVEELVGPEITSNPTQHVRMKLPERALTNRRDGLSAGVPFHQDQGVLLPEADDSDILTCWVAITDANESNGCLQVFPGSEHGRFLEHCPGDSAAMQGPGQLGIPARLLPAIGAKAPANAGRQTRCSSTATSYTVRGTTRPPTRSGSAWTCAISRPGKRADGRCSRASSPGANRTPARSCMTRRHGVKCGTTLTTGSPNRRHHSSTAGVATHPPAPRSHGACDAKMSQ